MTRRQICEHGLRKLHSDAGGVLRLMLVTAADVLVLYAAAAAGDRNALAYLRAIDTFHRRIDGAADDAPLCLTCDHRLCKDTPLFALVIPARDDASRCLALALCASCAAGHRDRADAELTIIGALRRMLWPDLRPIAHPADTAGRA